MNETREGAFDILVGTTNVGKSSRLKQAAEIANPRTLIIPPNRSDPAWKGIPELSWSVDYEPDPMDPRKERKVIICPELNTFQGQRVLHCDDNRVFQAVTHPTRGLRNAGLIIDDFKNVIYQKGDLPGEAASLFRSRRHYGLDIFLACHQFEDINRQMVALKPLLVIFQTTVPPNDTALSKIHRADELLALVDQVNKEAQVNPYVYKMFNTAD